MVGEHLADDERHLDGLLPRDAGQRVEVDPQLVGAVEVLGEHRVRVEVDAAEVDHPGQPGGVPDDDLLGRGPRAVVQRHRVEPVGLVRRDPLLEERLLVDALDEALEDHRPARDAAQRAVRDRQVVPDEVELGHRAPVVEHLREHDLVRVRDRDLAPGDLERDGGRSGCHRTTLRSRTSGPPTVAAGQAVGTDFPAPTAAAPSRAEVLLRYLDHFRDVVLTKVAALGTADAVGSRLASGWTPLELARHLTFVERRWLEWGFEDADLPEPWGDRDGDRWAVPAGTSVAEVLDALRARGVRSRQIVGRHDLDEPGLAASGRWDGAPPATLERVLLHLVQEYARHCGHLDVVVELAGGPTGE